MSMESYEICGVRQSACECVEPAGHFPSTPHACDSGCGGSWTFDADGEFVIVSMPSGQMTGRTTDINPDGSDMRPFIGGDSFMAAIMSGALGLNIPRGPIRYIQPPVIEASDG